MEKNTAESVPVFTGKELVENYKRWTKKGGGRHTHGLLSHVTCTQPERGVDITVIGFSSKTNTTPLTSGREDKTIYLLMHNSDIWNLTGLLFSNILSGVSLTRDGASHVCRHGLCITYSVLYDSACLISFNHTSFFSDRAATVGNNQTTRSLESKCLTFILILAHYRWYWAELHQYGTNWCNTVSIALLC